MDENIQIEFPYSKRTFRVFDDIWNRFHRNEKFVISLPDGGEILFFHFSGKLDEITSDIYVELKNSAYMKVFCCHPELLPAEIQKRHVFPNGFGICRMTLTEPEDGIALMLLENEKFGLL